ncbi:MAG: NlpC/P60 family protein [Pseudomonadota bacterium]
MALDRRVTPARPDLAASRLRGTVAAERYRDGDPMLVSVPLADLWAEPGRRNRTSQALFGETVDVYDIQGGVAWAQLRTDGYVGYLAAEALAPDPTAGGLRPDGAARMHRVAVPLTHRYPQPEVKAPAMGRLPMAARLRVLSQRNGFAETPQGWVPLAHLRRLDASEKDPVEIAERFLHAPYLWGGRSALGLDCSALVQLSAGACDIAAPRDSDMQEAALGRRLDPADALRRGDLVFWKGHVGWMRDATHLLHANAHHMQVASEPLEDARIRIAAAGLGEVTALRRL